MCRLKRRMEDVWFGHPSFLSMMSHLNQGLYYFRMFYYMLNRCAEISYRYRYSTTTLVSCQLHVYHYLLDVDPFRQSAQFLIILFLSLCCVHIVFSENNFSKINIWSPPPQGLVRFDTRLRTARI